MLENKTPFASQSFLLYRANDFIPNPSGYCSTLCAEARTLCLHSHDFYEIAYVIEGWGTHHTNTSSQKIKEGDYILISPGFAHCIVSPPESSLPRIRICNCLFTDAYFSRAIRHFFDIPSIAHTSLFQLLSHTAPFCLVLSDNEAQSIRTSLRMIQFEMNQNSLLFTDNRRPPASSSSNQRPLAPLVGSDSIIRNHLENFLIETGRIYERNLCQDALSGQNNQLIQDLVNYMRSHLDLPISLSTLADLVHFSPGYLSRYFRAHTGQTLHSYLFDLRMKKAEELLLHTAYPISEIGFLCGYSSISNFRKYFTKKFGISPRAYRKQYIPASHIWDH